jgi:hypothetical protein
LGTALRFDRSIRIRFQDDGRRDPREQRRRSPGMVQAAGRRCAGHRHPVTQRDRRQIAERCPQHDPGLPVIYVTGFSRVQARAVAGSLSLQKPYHPEDLSSRERDRKGKAGPAASMSSVVLPDACWFWNPTRPPRLVFRDYWKEEGYQQARRRQCPERRSPEAHPASKQDHGRKYLDQAR